MRAEILLRDAATNGSATVLIDAPGDATTDELLDALSPHIGGPNASVYLRRQLVQRGQQLSDLHIGDGTVLAVGAPLAEPTAPREIRLHIESGPCAGETVPLAEGTWILGRSNAHIIIPDSSVSTDHCQVTVTGYTGGQQVLVTDRGSSNGTLVDGYLLGRGQSHDLSPGESLTVGTSRLRLTTAPPPDLEIVHDSDTAEPQVKFQLRIDRFVAPAPTTVQWPSPPQVQETARIPIAMMIVPVVFAVVMALAMNRPYMLLFAAMSPVMALFNWSSDRSQKKKRTSKDAEQHREDVARARERVDRHAAAELASNRGRWPSPAETVETALLRSGRLWQRSASDDDCLEVRVGVIDRAPESVSITSTSGESSPELPILINNPVGVSLLEAGCLGIAGPDVASRGLARSVLLQLAAYHPPHQLSISAVFHDSGERDFEWIRWLPHCRSGGAVDVGSTSESVQELLERVALLVASRTQDAKAARGRISHTPHVVMLERTRDLPTALTHPILEDGPAVGVHCIVVEQQRSAIPKYCKVAVSIAPDTSGERFLATVERPDHVTLHAVEVETIEPEVAALAARSIAPLRPFIPAAKTGAELPDLLYLLDLMNLRGATPQALLTRWRQRRSSTVALLGASTAGLATVDFTLTPHMLIAGTTGTGKSEVLRTLITSLALDNAPDELNFVLLDFKGGGGLVDFEAIPHTVALVTSGSNQAVDSASVERTVRSLEVELSRREGLFRHHNASLTAYDRAREADPSIGEKVARLIIVIDEYAAFIEANPALDAQMVAIAQRGRSLGMHLVIGTQQPSTSVSNQILAQLPVSLTLRVRDVAESLHVIGSPAAAELPILPMGRAYLKQGSDLALAQMAVTGLVHRGTTQIRNPLQIVARPWLDASVPPKSATTAASDIDSGDSDLALITTAMKEAGKLGAFPAQSSPVPNPLPTSLRLDSLADEVDWYENPAFIRPVQWLEEHLWAQRVSPGGWMPEDGNLAIIGSSKSGRTSALRTTIGSLTRSLSPDDLHLYVFDLQGNMRQFEDVPHVGAVASRSDVGHMSMVTEWLVAELSRRRDLMMTYRAGSLDELRTAGHALPSIIAVIDAYDALLDPEYEAIVDATRRRLLPEGPPLGVSVVVTSDTQGMQRISDQFATKVVLQLHDIERYSQVGIRRQSLDRVGAPRRPGEGRRIVTVGQGEELVALQFAHLGVTPEAGDQATAIADLARNAPPSTSNPPERLRPLPYSVSAAELFATGTCAPPSSTAPVMIGVAAGRLDPIWVDLAGHRSFVVLGPGGSGRSTILDNIRTQLVRAHKQVVTLTHDLSADQIRRLPGEVVTLEHAAAVLPTLQNETYVIIDNVDFLEDLEIATATIQAIRDFAGPNFVVGAATDSLGLSMKRVLKALSDTRSGIVLSPNRGELRVLSSKLPKAIDGPAGRGYIIEHGASRLMQTVTDDGST